MGDKVDEENDEKDEKTAEDDTANETTANETTENEHTKKVDEAEVVDPSLEDELANSDVVAAEVEVNSDDTEQTLVVDGTEIKFLSKSGASSMTATVVAALA